VRLDVGLSKTPEGGRHWTRWNQAVEEAGFPPNTLTPKYADGTLGTCLAELARSLGTMPVKGDIDHKKATDPTFPSYAAFSRWKGSGTLASALHSFCGDRLDLSDVAAMCQSKAASSHPARTKDRRCPPPPRPIGKHVPGRAAPRSLHTNGRPERHRTLLAEPVRAEASDDQGFQRRDLSP